MITLAKVKDSFLEKSKMIIKVLQFGPKTAKQVLPFGIDSNPLENYTAIYAETSNAAEAVILGYINKNYITEKGEIRIYAADPNGVTKAYAHAKVNGVLELNGSEFSAVRFQNLKTAVDSTNTSINAELAKISTALASLGGVYTPAPVNTNLTSSESPTIKIK